MVLLIFLPFPTAIDVHLVQQHLRLFKLPFATSKAQLNQEGRNRNADPRRKDHEDGGVKAQKESLLIWG